MRRDWEPEELIDCWTLVDDDWALVANKSGPTRLGFAVLLKFFELEGRFPRHGGEVPKPALGYLASQLKVPAVAFADYGWTGRTIEYHRAQIRNALGFREATVDDEDELTWPDPLRSVHLINGVRSRVLRLSRRSPISIPPAPGLPGA